MIDSIIPLKILAYLIEGLRNIWYDTITVFYFSDFLDWNRSLFRHSALLATLLLESFQDIVDTFRSIPILIPWVWRWWLPFLALPISQDLSILDEWLILFKGIRYKYTPPATPKKEAISKGKDRLPSAIFQSPWDPNQSPWDPNMPL